jgi:cytochrome P450
LEESLVRWTKKNHAATFAQDRRAMSDIAREFEGFIDDLLDTRRGAGAKPEDDLTAALMHETVWGRPLSNEEIASILRNWTVGEIGTLAASVGILCHYLAEHGALRHGLREAPSQIPAAIEEILRIDGPLVASRRITTRPVQIGGRSIDAGERITLMWIAANRDGRVFDEPDAFRPDRDPQQNLLYGVGIHACPGAPLARLEMRIVVEELLARTDEIRLDPHKFPSRATYPASGFAKLPVRMWAQTAT